jgi:hypothetical protein
VTLDFLNDVLLLHFPLEATQGIFERLAFLQSDFGQRNYTPKPVLWDWSVIARSTYKVKHYMEFLASPSTAKGPLRIQGAAHTATGEAHTHSSLH